MQPCPSTISSCVCMLSIIYCNAMYHLSCVLPLSCVPGRVTRGALVGHRHSFALTCCKPSQYRRTFVTRSVSLWNDLSDNLFGDLGLADSQNRANAFLLN